MIIVVCVLHLNKYEYKYRI